jgi:hypothetical protein
MSSGGANSFTGLEAEAPYDWIIILGGTNDLGSGFDADVVFAGLKRSIKKSLTTALRF